MDFGLGIGYNSEPKAASSTGRSSAVNSLRSGVMAQFKSSFVAASSNSQNQGLINSNKKMTLPGFVSGGSIGGDVRPPSTTTSSPSLTHMPAGNASSQNTGHGSQGSSDR